MIRNPQQLKKLLKECAIVATNVTIIVDGDGKARIAADGDTTAALLSEAHKVLRNLVAAASTEGSLTRRLVRAIAAAEALVARIEKGGK